MFKLFDNFALNLAENEKKLTDPLLQITKKIN